MNIFERKPLPFLIVSVLIFIALLVIAILSWVYYNKAKNEDIVQQMEEEYIFGTTASSTYLAVGIGCSVAAFIFLIFVVIFSYLEHKKNKSLYSKK